MGQYLSVLLLVIASVAGLHPTSGPENTITFPKLVISSSYGFSNKTNGTWSNYTAPGVMPPTRVPLSSLTLIANATAAAYATNISAPPPSHVEVNPSLSFANAPNNATVHSPWLNHSSSIASHRISNSSLNLTSSREDFSMLISAHAPCAHVLKRTLLVRHNPAACNTTSGYGTLPLKVTVNAKGRITFDPSKISLAYFMYSSDEDDQSILDEDYFRFGQANIDISGANDWYAAWSAWVQKDPLLKEVGEWPLFYKHFIGTYNYWCDITFTSCQQMTNLNEIRRIYPERSTARRVYFTIMRYELMHNYIIQQEVRSP